VSQGQRSELSIESGFISSVEYEGQRFDIQTQSPAPDAPVIESLVFQDGEVVVRVTSSYREVASQLGFTNDDGRHLLELQHADLVRKIRNGMLRDDDAASPSESPRLGDGEGIVTDPAEIDDPAVKQLLSDLGVAIDRASSPPPADERREPDSPPSAEPRRKRPRFVIRIVLPF
jgi:hypothetical protein